MINLDFMNRVNLCCGKDYREGYTNVDFVDVASDLSPIKVDVVLDVRRQWPWPARSVDEMVFRESLEHFNRLDGLDILQKIYYVLDDGAKLDLSVPNATRQLKMLLAHASRPTTFEEFISPHQPPWGWWKYHEDLMGATHRSIVEGKDVGQGDSHKTLYTKQSLQTVLEAVGFKIESIKEDSSIYVIARK